MSDVLARLRPPRARTAPRSAVGSVWVQGAFAAAWAFLVGAAALVVVSLIVWAADSTSVAGATGAMRFGVQLWLLAQRTPLQTTGGALSIPPLGLTLALVALLARASLLVARGAHCRSRADLGNVVVAVTLPYAVLATLLAAAARSDTFRPSTGAAFVCAALVGGLASSIGALRGSGLDRPTWRALPVTVRTAADAAARSGLTLLAGATSLLVISLLIHVREVASVTNDYRGGSGRFAMIALSLVFIPNAVVFAASYIVGSGFAIGSGTSVTLAGSHLGAVPAFPLVAAVPSGPPPWPVMVFAVLAVGAAGVAAGWRVACRSGSIGGCSREDRLGRWQQVRAAVIAAAALGIASAALGGFAGGPVGPGRMSAVGPSPWRVGLMVAGEVAVVGVLTVLACAWLGARRQRR